MASLMRCGHWQFTLLSHPLIESYVFIVIIDQNKTLGIYFRFANRPHWIIEVSER